MIFPPCPQPPTSAQSTTPSSVTYTIQGEDEPYQSAMPRVIQRNFQSPQSELSDTLIDIHKLRSWKEGWNGYDAPAPNPASIEHAMAWIKLMFVDAGGSRSPWIKPNVIADGEGDVVFEWWHGQRKITVYVSPTSAEYIKVWGANIFDEMEDGILRNSSERRALWNWLHA